MGQRVGEIASLVARVACCFSLLLVVDRQSGSEKETYMVELLFVTRCGWTTEGLAGSQLANVVSAVNWWPSFKAVVVRVYSVIACCASHQTIRENVERYAYRQIYIYIYMISYV